MHEQYQQNIKPKEDDLLYIDAIKLCEKFKSLQRELTERELINYKRIKEIPFLFDYVKNLEVDDKHPDSYFYDYNSFKKFKENTLKNAPLCSTDKYDFMAMLNIMYEDQYLSYFKEENYLEHKHYEMGDDKYLEKFGHNGDLDVKDIKDIEEFGRNGDLVVKDFKGIGELGLNVDLDFLSFVNCFKKISIKENLMTEEYPFIKRLSVIYELCDRDKHDFYRRFIIFDPINKNFFLIDGNYGVDEYFFALNTKISKKN